MLNSLARSWLVSPWSYAGCSLATRVVERANAWELLRDLRAGGAIENTARNLASGIGV